MITLIGLMILWGLWANRISPVEVVYCCALMMLLTLLSVVALDYQQIPVERSNPSTEGPVRCYDIDCLA